MPDAGEHIPSKSLCLTTAACCAVAAVIWHIRPARHEKERGAGKGVSLDKGNFDSKEGSDATDLEAADAALPDRLRCNSRLSSTSKSSVRGLLPREAIDRDEYLGAPCG